ADDGSGIQSIAAESAQHVAEVERETGHGRLDEDRRDNVDVRAVPLQWRRPRPTCPLIRMPRYLERPDAATDHAKEHIVVPYGMTARAVLRAINDVYAYLHALNRASVEHGYDRLEDLMQPAGFSGLLSNLFVRSVARECSTMTPGLAINQHGG